MWTEHVLEALEQQLEAQVIKPCKRMCYCTFSAWGKQIWAQRLCTYWMLRHTGVNPEQLVCCIAGLASLTAPRLRVMSKLPAVA